MADKRLRYSDYYDEENNLKIEAARKFLLEEMPNVVGKLVKQTRALDGLQEQVREDDTACQVVWNGIVMGSIGPSVMYGIEALKALEQGVKFAEGKTYDEARSFSARKGIESAKKSLQKFMDALDEADEDIAEGADANDAMHSAFTKHLFGEDEEEEEGTEREKEDAEELEDVDQDIQDLLSDIENKEGDEAF